MGKRKNSSVVRYYAESPNITISQIITQAIADLKLDASLLESTVITYAGKEVSVYEIPEQLHAALTNSSKRIRGDYSMDINLYIQRGETVTKTTPRTMKQAVKRAVTRSLKRITVTARNRVAREGYSA